MEIDDGGSAFPNYKAQEDRNANDGTMSMYLDQSAPGMSLRDYFAAAAITGWLANAKSYEGVHSIYWPGTAAEWCYAIADAMLAARSKDHSPASTD